MNKFTGSIRKKLIAIILLISTISTLIIYNFFIYKQLIDNQKQLVKISNNVADILSQDIVKLIYMNDISTAADISSKLKSFKQLNKMVLFNIDSKEAIFQYNKDNKTFKVKKLKDEKNRVNCITDNNLTVYVNAKYQNNLVAYIKLEFYIDTFFDLLKKNAFDFTIIFLIVILLSIILAIYFSKKFTNPIINLVSFLEGIDLIESLNKKINTNENNEYGKLYNEINTMLQRLNTSQKTLQTNQAILVQQSKMASMGEMISHIAHQWRQPLSVITTLASGIVIKKELGLEISKEEEIKVFNDIQNSTEFLSKTIDDFRNFFEKDKEFCYTNLTNIYKSTMIFIEYQITDFKIKLVEEIEDINISTIENELKQVFMNIINNAKDELKNKEYDKFIFINIYKENKNVIINIKDNAGGISDDIINKIFDAYFSTKLDKNGTGIGLHMSKEIIVNHLNGNITVNNETFIYDNVKYKGASFKIILPLQNI